VVPRASGGNPGQDDPDAAGALDLGPGPGMDTSLGHPTVRKPADGHARDAKAELTAAAQTAKGAGGYGCSARPHPARRHAE
jgi:hypothetical protein